MPAATIGSAHSGTLNGLWCNASNRFPGKAARSELNCKGVIRKLSNYIDGDLDPAVKQELERHFARCEDCSMIVDATRKTIQLYCGSEPVALPSDLRERLDTALRQKTGQKISKTPFVQVSVTR